jgi:hypothetical protein
MYVPLRYKNTPGMTRWHSPIVESMIVSTQTLLDAAIITNNTAQAADSIGRTYCKWPYKDKFLDEHMTVESLLRQARRSARLKHISNLRKIINENPTYADLTNW